MSSQRTFIYSFDGQTYATEDAILSGRQIRSQASLSPASGHILIKLGSSTMRSVGLEETIDLTQSKHLGFRSFPGDRIYTFTVN